MKKVCIYLALVAIATSWISCKKEIINNYYYPTPPEDTVVVDPPVDDSIAAVLEVRLAADNPAAQIILADANSSTDSITLLKGTLKAVGSDISINGMVINITKIGTGNIDQIASHFILKINGEEVDSKSPADCMAPPCTSLTESYDFDDVEVTIEEGDNVEFELLADIYEIDGVIVREGDALSASVVVESIKAKDAASENLTSDQLIGMATGNSQTFVTQSIFVTKKFVFRQAVSVDGAADYGDYKMKVSVTAVGEDVYIDKSFTASTSGSMSAVGSNRVAVLNASGVILTSGFSAGISSDDNNAREMTNTYKISEGVTADFTISISATGTSTQQRAILFGIEWGTTDQVTLTNVYTLNMGVDGEYKSTFIYVSGM